MCFNDIVGLCIIYFKLNDLIFRNKEKCNKKMICKQNNSFNCYYLSKKIMKNLTIINKIEK